MTKYEKWLEEAARIVASWPEWKRNLIVLWQSDE